MRTQGLGLAGLKRKRMCRDNGRKGNILAELLLLLAIVILFVKTIKAIHKWYITLQGKQKVRFWVGLMLLYFFGLML